MKKIVILICAACLAAVSCGDANQAYVRKAVKIMDKEGLFATGEQWEAAKAEALGAKPANLEAARDVVAAALKVAGGKHSSLYLPDPEIPVTNANDSEWRNPEVAFQEDGIAVIYLRSFTGDADEGVKYANDILDALSDHTNIKGAVINLMGNIGGNMYPMIAAIHRFLPDGDILRFRTRKRTQWVMLENVLQIAGVQRQPRIECPVAILTNEWTGSSGEAVLLCFRGLDNVRVFGSPTAGYASSNQPFTMSDGATMWLTTGCDVARTGEAFCDDPINPDVNTKAPLEDALEWLRSQ